MGMGFQFEQHRLGLWDLSWDLKKKTISWEMGLGSPLNDPQPKVYTSCVPSLKVFKNDLCLCVV